MLGRRRYKLATAVFLTLILTIALAPVAAAQQPPPLNEPNGSGGVVNTNTPPPTNTGSGGNEETTDPPNLDNGETTLPPDLDNGGGNGGGTMMPAPSWPPSNMIVTHAATQVQLSPVNGGLQTYFIAPGGVGHSGPWIDSFASLAAKHPTGGAITLYTGSNPGTGKPITIYYLASEQKIRVSTFYPDNQYDVNKPYVFTVDSGHNIVHEQW